MALGDLTTFAHSHAVASDVHFASVFIHLISSRPGVCAEAMDRFADLRTLGARTVFQEFEKCLQDSTSADSANDVKIRLYPLSEEKEAVLSLSLLQAASVLLSIWTEQEGDNLMGKDPEASSEAEATRRVAILADMLLHPIKSEEHTGPKMAAKGLASATMVESGKSAVSVESVSYRVWSSLALILRSHKACSGSCWQRRGVARLHDELL